MVDKLVGYILLWRCLENTNLCHLKFFSTRIVGAMFPPALSWRKNGYTTVSLKNQEITILSICGMHCSVFPEALYGHKASGLSHKTRQIPRGTNTFLACTIGIQVVLNIRPQLELKLLSLSNQMSSTWFYILFGTVVKQITSCQVLNFWLCDIVMVISGKTSHKSLFFQCHKFEWFLNEWS